MLRSCRFLQSPSRLLSRNLFGVQKQGKKESQSKVLGDVSSQVYELQGMTRYLYPRSLFDSY